MSRDALPCVSMSVSDTETQRDRGVNVAVKYRDICRIVAAFWREPKTQTYLRARSHQGHAARRIEMEDFCHDVILLILRHNGTPSSYDPSRGSLSKYVRLAAFSALTHSTDRRDTEALMVDPDRWSRVAERQDDIESTRRAFVASHEAELKALSKKLRAEKKTGQVPLFRPEIEQRARALLAA